jgi:hypothetical protein
MAKAKENAWIPSGGVLVVAVVSAVLAAILLNIYIGLIEAPYENKVTFLALDENVAKGEALETGHLTEVAVPEPLARGDAFEQFVPVEEMDVVLRKKAQWDLRKGNWLTFRDVGQGVEQPVLEDLPKGYEMLTIDIEPEPSVQPGVFVNIRGRFDMNPDNRTEEIEVLDVLYDVKIKTVGGSAEAAGSRRRAADNVQIFLPREHVKRLLQIKERMAGDRFLVTVLRAGADLRSEPAFAPEVLDLMRGAEPEPILP